MAFPSKIYSQWLMSLQSQIISSIQKSSSPVLCRWSGAYLLSGMRWTIYWTTHWRMDTVWKVWQMVAWGLYILWGWQFRLWSVLNYVTWTGHLPHKNWTLAPTLGQVSSVKWPLNFATYCYVMHCYNVTTCALHCWGLVVVISVSLYIPK